MDLEGDSLGARKTKNVFNIQTPVAIALGVRYAEPKPDEPAEVHYAKLEGTREGKLEQLGNIQSFADVTWQTCFSGWQNPFLPEGAGDYYTWPLITDLFPWQLSGVMIGRNWPIEVDKQVLEKRWGALIDSPQAKRKSLFKNSPTGRNLTRWPRIAFLCQCPNSQFKN